MELHTECTNMEQPQELRGLEWERFPLGLTALRSILYPGGRDWFFFLSTNLIEAIDLPRDLSWYKSKLNHHLNLSISGQPSDYMLWTKAANRHQDLQDRERGHCLRCSQQSLDIISRPMVAAGASAERSDLADNWNPRIMVYSLYCAVDSLRKSEWCKFISLHKVLWLLLKV